MTGVLQNICNTKDVHNIISSKICKNFRVLPVEACYGIRMDDWDLFFEEELLSETISRINNTLIKKQGWNGCTLNVHPTIDMNVAYIDLAMKHCPRTVAACEIF